MMANWPTPMAGTPAQNGNNAAGNNDFTRRGEDLAGRMWMTPDTPTGGRSMPEGTTPTGQTPAREGWTPEKIEAAQQAVKAKSQNGNGFGIGLAAQASMWTTPQAHDVTMRGAGQVPTSKAGNACLARDAAMWGTSRGSDGEKGGPNMSFGAGGTPLPSQAANWPTASARDHKGSSQAALTRRDGKSRLDLLDFAAEQGFSHPALPTWMPGTLLSPTIQRSRHLFRLATSRLSPATLRRLLKRGNWRKRRLNPVFVNSLMGWPPGHALCACSAMEWSRWQRHMRGALSALPTASGAWIWEPPIERPQLQQLSLL